jgi:hypothetical protein
MNAVIIWRIDDYGRKHMLLDFGNDDLEGELQMADGPMRYWIPRAVVNSWRPAS